MTRPRELVRGCVHARTRPESIFEEMRMDVDSSRTRGTSELGATSQKRGDSSTHPKASDCMRVLATLCIAWVLPTAALVVRGLAAPSSAPPTAATSAAAAAAAAASRQPRWRPMRPVLVRARSGAAAMASSMADLGFTISKPGSMTRDERLKSRYGGWAFQPADGWSEEASQFSYDDLAASIKEITSYSRGDTCTGTIIGFDPNGALVEIGVKSSAYVSLTEMALVKPAKPEDALEVGASYEFTITSREDENGQLMLSRRRLLFAEAWDKVTALHAEDASVEAEISAINRGGAMMTVHGLRAFLPGSHFLAGQNPTDDLIGTSLQVKFLDVDREANRLVVSHRKAVVDSQINNLSVGSVLTGVVTAVKPYGAFVDVGGMSGLLHISQISCDHISNVEARPAHGALPTPCTSPSAHC